MEEIDKETAGDVTMSNSDVTFDNLIILKEFSKIVNNISAEEFLNTVPKAKMKRVKWAPLFNCLKQGILDEVIQDMNAMWASEDMPQKLEIIQKQCDKYSHVDPDKVLWRPQLGNVKGQLKAHDVANLLKQQKSLEILAQEYEERVNRLKTTLSAKRGYIKAMQMDIHKYQKKNEILLSKISEKLEKHHSLTKIVIGTKPDIELDWSINELDVDNKKNA